MIDKLAIQDPAPRNKLEESIEVTEWPVAPLVSSKDPFAVVITANAKRARFSAKIVPVSVRDTVRVINDFLKLRHAERKLIYDSCKLLSANHKTARYIVKAF